MSVFQSARAADGPARQKTIKKITVFIWSIMISKNQVEFQAFPGKSSGREGNGAQSLTAATAAPSSTSLVVEVVTSSD